MNLFQLSVTQPKKMLTNLEKWLETAVTHAQKKSIDPNVFLTCRLIADQYPLVRQIQSACDSAKFAAARLTGKEAPKHEDVEKTMDEIRARVRTCIAYLDTFKAEDFNGAEARPVTLPFLEGKTLLGSDYLCEMVIPNFYFHVTHAYAILRSNGVEIGKTSYLGSLTTRDR